MTCKKSEIRPRCYLHSSGINADQDEKLVLNWKRAKFRTSVVKRGANAFSAVYCLIRVFSYISLHDCAPAVSFA